jgi:soluble lytic murein transglycosylase-like protein
LGAARPVQAEIYTCLDANGGRVLTNNPATCGQTKTFVVPGSSYRTTRPPSAAGSSAYDGIIAQAAEDYDVRADLVRAVVQVESGFNPRARSPKGAMGLMQLMPQTAAEYGVRNAYNPTENIRGGVAYLRTLLDRYQDETLALAAYNAGPTAVEKYGNNVPPYRETQQYVDKVQTITAAEPAPRPGRTILYKTLVLNDNGQLVLRLSDTKPSLGPYEIVRR